MINYVFEFDTSLNCSMIEHFNVIKDGDALQPIAREYVHGRSYIAAIDTGTNTIVGLLCYNPNSFYAKNCFGLGYVSVTQAFKNKGIATALLDAWFTRAKSLGKVVRIGHYEPEGKKWLPAVVDRLTFKHNIQIVG